MDGWTIGLLAVAGYLAAMTLVRLMIGRRNQLMEAFRRQVQSGKNHNSPQQHESSRPAQEKKAA